jgi:HPt (histidine-containing phosphotransfer) domain-containing protein
MSETSDHDSTSLPGDGQAESPPIDVAALLTRCQNNAVLARRLAARFLTESPTQLGRVRDAIVSRDGASAAKLLHKLRGSLGVFGAATAHELAQRLEIRAAAGELDDSDALLAALEREVDRARGALEHLEA